MGAIDSETTHVIGNDEFVNKQSPFQTMKVVARGRSSPSAAEADGASFLVSPLCMCREEVLVRMVKAAGEGGRGGDRSNDIWSGHTDDEAGSSRIGDKIDVDMPMLGRNHQVK